MAAPGEEVREWLASDAKLERYFDNFMQSGLDTLSKCCTLDDTMLDLLGIELIGHRKRLIAVSKKLQERLENEGLFARPELPDKDDSPPPALPPKKKNSSALINEPEVTSGEQFPPPELKPRMSSLRKSSPSRSKIPTKQAESTDDVPSSPSPFTDDPPPLPPKDGCPVQLPSPVAATNQSMMGIPPVPAKDGCSAHYSFTSPSGTTIDPVTTGPPPLPPKETHSQVPEASDNSSVDTPVSSSSTPVSTPTETGPRPKPAPRLSSVKKVVAPVPVPRSRPTSAVETSASSKRGQPPDMVRHHSDDHLLSQCSTTSDKNPKPPPYQPQGPQEFSVNFPSLNPSQPLIDNHNATLIEFQASSSAPVRKITSVPEQPYAMIGQILDGIGPPPRDKSMSPPGVSMNQPQPPSYQPSQNSIQPPSYQPSQNSIQPPSYQPSQNSIQPPSYQPSQNSMKPAVEPANNSNLYWVVSDTKPVALQPGSLLPEGSGVYGLAGATPSSIEPTAVQPSKVLPEENGIYELAGAPPSNLSTRQPSKSSVSTKQTPIHPYSQLQESEYSLIGQVVPSPGPSPNPGSGLVNRLPQQLPSGSGEYTEIGQGHPNPGASSRSNQQSPASDLKGGGSSVLRSQKSVNMQPTCRVSVIQPSDTGKKSKEGYLYKQGGIDSTKGWKHRWVIFNGQELKYYRNKNDKDSEVLKTVPLRRMLNVTQEIDEKDKAHPFHFTLITAERAFLFASEKRDDCLVWSSTLLAAIMQYKPTEEDLVEHEGGKMHTPDMQGFLKKQGHSVLGDWKQRYVALKGESFCYYKSQEDWKSGLPIHEIQMKTSKVRPLGERHRFEIITPNKHYQFQAQSDDEMKQWTKTLENAILIGLEEPKGDGASNDILEFIRTNPSNCFCADCGDKEPTWASINLGITVCAKCSGVHRSMGVHISKVRSTGLDKYIWTSTVKQLIVEIGNDKSNSFWLHHLRSSPPTSDVEDSVRDNFIRFKYENRAWSERTGLEDQEEELDKV